MPDIGTIRIIAKGHEPCRYTRSGWRKCKASVDNALAAAKLFASHHHYSQLIDKKDPRFLKGQLSPQEKCQGARISFLPDGRKADKAFSLFAKHLTLHDESSHDHWDALFQNPGGTWAYVYATEKREQHVKKKYRLVKEFEKRYPVLRTKVRKALHNDNDNLALPMYTLLKTCMRIGSETYYRAHGHKGLTTLKKHDIKLRGNLVNFNYLSKGGVPMNIIEQFPGIYTKRLQSVLAPLKRKSFVFTNSRGHPLTDTHFKEAFKKYCGVEFYPHIVRSYYATARVKQFLQKHRKARKEEVRELFASIAEKLGHRKFDKKSGEWKESYNITINYYVQPEILDKVRKITD